ncbi:Uma2 family endonuclease [Pseudanabaenaceae cyanobacterium LEGE 13415]|nr:Uma2 family endonuclease [Pseudanabaenaceae cyanobacterium LEGE 13415]
MVTQPQLNQISYPESDGKPMADNTKQFRWIVVIEQNLEWLFADDPNVFVAGDLLWYPVEGNNRLCTAPDAMVVFGRPKGDRGSYLQWKEDHIPPQVVFEILSPGNTVREMNRKLLFYSTYGVEEYYLYDPDQNRLEGWCRSEDPLLDQIESIDGWISPRLGIRFELGEELQLYRPDGVPFFSFAQINQMLDQERQRTELERQRAEQSEQRAEEERQRAEQERQRAAEMERLLQQYRDRYGELDR